MVLPPGLRRLLRLQTGRPAPAADIDDEIAYHLQARTEELIGRGLPPESARAEAERQFGSPAVVAAALVRIDAARDARFRRRAWRGELRQDLRQGLRTIRRTPAYALVAILTFALGIGANTAVFSVLDAALLRPLSLPDAGRLVRIYERDPDRAFGRVTAADFQDWRGMAGAFSGMAAFRFRSFTLEGEAEAEHLVGGLVTPDFFDVLDARPLMGRWFRPDEGLAGAPPVVVVSHAAWVRVLGRDSSVVGRSVRLSGEPATVIGVLPPDFPDVLGSRVELWQPSTFDDLASDPVRGRRFHTFSVFARLRPGLALGRAREELRAIGARLAQEYPDQNLGHEPNMVALQVAGTESAGPALWMAMGAVGFVLLIACANLANLVFARSLARGREFALRSAIGAGGFRLARQVVTEQLVLAVAGGTVGIAAATWTSALFARTAGSGLPRADLVGVDLRVVGFAVGVTAVAAVLSSVVPALWAARGSHASRLQAGGAGSTLSRGSHRVRAALVAVQVALAGVLLVGCGLALRSLSALLSEDLGFRPESVWTFTANTAAARYQDEAGIIAFQHQLLEGIRSLPGVEAASASYAIPMSNVSTISMAVEGRAETGGPPPEVGYNAAEGEYFRTLGIPLLRGRLMDQRDGLGTLPVVVVNRTLAEGFWPGEDPIGRRARVGDDPNVPWFTVVGVVGDIRRDRVAQAPEPEAYFALAQYGQRAPTYVVRLRGEAAPTLARIRETLRTIDPAIPLASVAPLREAVDLTVAAPRLLGVLLSTFAGIALLMAAVGVYGVIAFLIAERRREIGIRMALGATAGRMLRQTIGRGLRPVLVGLVAGLGLALIVGRFVAALFYEVTSTDPLTYAAVTVVLLLAGLVGCLAPARRAARVDPAGVLRE